MFSLFNMNLIISYVRLTMNPVLTIYRYVIYESKFINYMQHNTDWAF